MYDCQERQGDSIISVLKRRDTRGGVPAQRMTQRRKLLAKYRLGRRLVAYVIRSFSFKQAEETIKAACYEWTRHRISNAFVEPDHELGMMGGDSQYRSNCASAAFQSLKNLAASCSIDASGGVWPPHISGFDA